MQRFKMPQLYIFRKKKIAFMPWITEMTLKETTSFHHEIGQHTISTVLTA